MPCGMRLESAPGKTPEHAFFIRPLLIGVRQESGALSLCHGERTWSLNSFDRSTFQLQLILLNDFPSWQFL